MSYMETYREWCTNPYFSEETRAELEAIKDNEAEIEDRFYRQLEFGTGGLRGVIGAGTNRMNIYTVRQANTGTCKLYHFPERTGKRRCHRPRFQNHVAGICRGGSTLSECKRNQGLCV